MFDIRAALPTEGTRLAKCYWSWYYLVGKIRRGGYVFFTWKREITRPGTFTCIETAGSS